MLYEVITSYNAFLLHLAAATPKDALRNAWLREDAPLSSYNFV